MEARRPWPRPEAAPLWARANATTRRTRDSSAAGRRKRRASGASVTNALRSATRQDGQAPQHQVGNLVEGCTYICAQAAGTPASQQQQRPGPQRSARLGCRPVDERGSGKRRAGIERAGGVGGKQTPRPALYAARATCTTADSVGAGQQARDHGGGTRGDGAAEM